jgi:hypothetical protein
MQATACEPMTLEAPSKHSGLIRITQQLERYPYKGGPRRSCIRGPLHRDVHEDWVKPKQPLGPPMTLGNMAIAEPIRL